MRILPKSLFGRLVLLLLTGLILAQLLSAFILLRDRGQALYASQRENLVERTLGIVHLLDSLSTRDRLRLVPLLTTPALRITLSDQPLPTPEQKDDAASTADSEILRQRIQQRLPPNTEVQVTLQGSIMEVQMPAMHRRMMRGSSMPRPLAYMQGLHTMARLFVIQVKLQDGSWVIFKRGLTEQTFNWPSRLLIVLGVLLVSVILLSLIGVRSIVRPLRNLRKAAEGLGKDIHQPPLQETGPAEVRDTARAFNTMQTRLKSYIEDRADILAAVSHDLKTPLTRMRLRTDLLDDEELRGRMQKDLEDMESMVSATLDFMRGTETGEQNQILDLMALLESIQEDAIEMGSDVQLQGHILKPFNGKPLALKRCLVNLVENALRYGRQAEIKAEDTGQEIRIFICDNGPGIPEQMLQKVFDPFFRLETSRAEHTGGTGLGLGIARNIARAHGGDLTLHNRSEGGLCAQLNLPR